jgi:hypothetical protein
MTGNRQKGAWVWVAMVAISFASLARVQSGVENARAYADPVIKFIAAAHQADADASAKAHRGNAGPQAGTTGVGVNLLAVFFVGLVAPLGVWSLWVGSQLRRVSKAPVLAVLFQRPPPSLLA